MVSRLRGNDSSGVGWQFRKLTDLCGCVFRKRASSQIKKLEDRVLNKAHKEWRWLDSIPLIRMRKIENKRIRWLSKGQANKLLKELPNHLRDMAAFTLATGLRQSNVTGLQWNEVDLTKNMRSYTLINLKQRKPFLYP